MSESMQREQAGARSAILVIDDDELIRLMLQRQLDRLGYDVLAAPDGASGLEQLEAVPAGLRAILIDLSLPDIDGAEIARRCKAQAPGLPVLLISGFFADDLAARFADLGVAGFLQKPFTLASLRDALTKAGVER